MNTLVIGIGNTLLQDEGVGVHAVRYLSRHCRHQYPMSCLEGGTLGKPLSIPIHLCDSLIIIDAADIHDSPGAVAIFVGHDMDMAIRARRNRSIHNVGLSDFMSLIRLTDNLPQHRALISIQPKTIAWGDSLTDDVFATIPITCDKTLQLVAKWKQ